MLENALAHFQANVWLYLSMPVTAGLMAWGTNWLAIRMMFYPLNFLGIRPWLGWQGIIPRKRRKIAGLAVQTLVPALISEREIFGRLDPVEVARRLEPATAPLAREITDLLLQRFSPRLAPWVPEPVRERLRNSGGSGDTHGIAAGVMKDIQDNIDQLFDLKAMVVDTLARDKRLINRIFQETGKAEFKFIELSGLYLGFLFGIVQMVGWMFYQAPWQLPLIGLIVGYATNWIALELIFRPQHPRKFGPILLQGLFHKRQQEVALNYSRLVASQVVTPSHIVESVLAGPNARLLHRLLERQVRRELDRRLGRVKALLLSVLGQPRLDALVRELSAHLGQHLPQLMRSVDDYAAQAMDLDNTIRERLARLPPDDFENMLRPAFKEDEWILIAVGGALGFAVGLGQMAVFALFSTAV